MTELYEGLSRGVEMKEGDNALRQLLLAAVLHPLKCLLAVSPTAPRVRPLEGDIVAAAWKLPNADAAATEDATAAETHHSPELNKNCLLPAALHSRCLHPLLLLLHLLLLLLAYLQLCVRCFKGFFSLQRLCMHES